MSPCLMHCWYWAFLLSGRLVITIPPTWEEVLHHDGFDLEVNLVDLGVKPSAGDEPAEFLVHVGLGHTKCICERKDDIEIICQNLKASYQPCKPVWVSDRTRAAEHRLSPVKNNFKSLIIFCRSNLLKRKINLDLSDIVGVMGSQIAICFHNLKQRRHQECKKYFLQDAHNTCSSFPRAVKKSLYWQLYRENR